MKGSWARIAATSLCCPTASTTLLNLGYESAALLSSRYPKAYARSLVSTLNPYLFQASANTVSSFAMDSQRSAGLPKDILTSEPTGYGFFFLYSTLNSSLILPPCFSNVLLPANNSFTHRTQARSHSSCFYPPASFSHGAAQLRTGLARKISLLNMLPHAQTI